MKSYNVVLDAGHGGKDSGAIGSKSYEKNLALSIVKQMQSHLEAAGVKVVLTRSTDVYISLSYRSDVSNNAKADAFVSVHLNSATSKTATGTETLYMRDKDLPLAKAVHPKLINATGLRDRGIKYQNVSVVRKTKAPAILVEVGFISNQSDEAKMVDDSYRNGVAKAIADGVLAFLGVSVDRDEAGTYQLLASDGHGMDVLSVYDGAAYVSAQKWGAWFGMAVGFDDATRKVLLDGQPLTTKIISSAGYIPIREAAAAIGLSVIVDNANRTIMLKRECSE